jgi:nicotinamide mononucleotide transporter
MNWMDWLLANWIEVLGAAFTLLFLALEVLRKWTMWVIGIISGLFYVYLNYDAALYAMMGLSLFNVIVAIYGLYCWRVAKTQDKKDLPFIFVKRRTAVGLTIAGVLLAETIGWLLIKYTNIAPPLSSVTAFFSFILDTLIATVSILASWMAARKMVESWYLWIFINPCNITVYLIKGMYPSSVLYLLFFIFSIVGYFQWRKAANKQIQESLLANDDSTPATL